MTGQTKWSLVFVVPSLGYHDGTDDPRAAHNLHGLAIVPASDERVAALRSQLPVVDELLASFRLEYGQPLDPMVLIATEAWLQDFGKSAEPIVSFRNVLWLADVLLTRARIHEAGWSGNHWSDSYDFHPAQVATTGDRVDVITPATSHFGVPLEGYRWTHDIGLPRSDPSVIDEELAVRLLSLWKLRYRLGRERRATEPVFRSLEAACHATSIRFKNYGSIYDVGMSAGYWVTALEILAGAGRASVGRKQVRSLVAEFKWPGPHLCHRRYRVPTAWRQHRPTRWGGANLAVKITDLLYEARNRYVHGRPITPRILLPFGRGSGRQLLALASTVYRAGLLAYLNRHWPRASTMETGLTFLHLLGGATYALHLDKVLEEEDD